MNLLNKPYIYVLAVPLVSVYVLFPKFSVFLLPILVVLMNLAYRNTQLLSHMRHLIMLLLFVFLTWAASSTAWSLDPWMATKSVGLAFFIALLTGAWSRSLCAATPANQDSFISLFAISFIMSLFLWGIELGLHGPLLKFSLQSIGKTIPPDFNQIAYKSTAFTMGGLVFILVGWALSQRKVWGAILVWLTTLLMAYASHSTTAALGIFLGGCVMALVYALPHIINWILMGAVVLINFGLPYLFYTRPVSQWAQQLMNTYGQDAFSFYHRTIIWEFTVKKWLESPWLGWGAGSSKSIPGAEQEVIPQAHVLSLHPHNYALQTSLETGVVGNLLYTGFLVALIWTLHKALETRAAQAMSLGLFWTFYTFSNAEHSLWHHWWLAWIGLAAGLCVFMCFWIERTLVGQSPSQTRGR